MTVAIVGVVGTLLGAVVGAVLAPWVGGRMERRQRISIGGISFTDE